MKSILGMLCLVSALLGGGCQPSPVDAKGAGQVSAFVSGVTESFHADFASTSQAHMGNVDGSNSMLGASFDCRFAGSVKIVKNQTRTVWLISVDTEQLILKSGSAGLESIESKVVSELKAPFIVNCEPSGRVQSCQFDASISLLTRKLQRTIVGLMQLVRTQDAKREWTCREDDTIGTREVRYTTATGGRVSKVALQYVANTDDKNRISTAGKESFWLRNGEIERIEGRESSRSTGQIGATWSKSDMRYRFRRLAVQKATQNLDTLVARLSNEKAETLWQRETAQEISHDLAVQTLGSDTVDTILAKLEQLDQHALKAPLSTDDQLKLEAMVTLYSEALPRLTAILRSADIPSDRYRAATQALIGSGSSPAQRTLLDFIAANLKSQEVQLHLIPSLASLADPAPDSTKALEEVAGQTASPVAAKTATFVLGAFAGRLKSKSPLECQAITEYLAAKLKGASSQSDRVVALGALGNIGSDKAAAEVERVADDPDVVVRGEAMIALRLCPGDRPQAILFAHLAKDPSSEVRLKAVFALSFSQMSDPVVTAILVSAKTDESTRVRTACIEALSRYVDKSPAISTVLEEISRTDPSQEIRKRAHELIHGTSKS